MTEADRRRIVEAVRKLVLNPEAAKELGITFPADLLREAGHGS